MDLVRTIYSSQPFAFDTATLGNILVIARKNNAHDGISGALVCRRDIFLQLLEGPRGAVAAAMGRIVRDDRHLNVTVHVDGPAPERMFGAWAMLHDPAPTWLWPPESIRDGVPQGVGGDAILEVFRTLARQAARDPV